ncbi:MAG: hypothetical protein FWE42_06200 [Defluviitaleaceae bacterium]|nr:hypothetical protein [Defluviitaleaceae bacterium]
MTIDFSKIKTWSARDRVNLVKVEDLLVPGQGIHEWDTEGFDGLCQRILGARAKDKPVIFSMGAHVIKSGLSLYLVDMMKRGLITHIAGNGACSIHDFELGYLGGTSEHVPTAIEDGSFGMWEETGAWMNEALNQGAAQGLGYGESLGAYIEKKPDRFPYKDSCVLYQAHCLGIPITYHIALGTDIIHQHPTVDFGAIGAASGVDFKKLCGTVAGLEGGVFLNFGSAVIGPEVFLKALSIARNLGNLTQNITTANFDLRPVQDPKGAKGYSSPDYYYRPLKNIVSRPTSRGGMGWHFCGNHVDTIPALYDKLVAKQNKTL